MEYARIPEQEVTDAELDRMKGIVVQFTEKHKWCGALGIITEVKKCGDDYRFQIACTIPDNKDACHSAYIFSMVKSREFEPLFNGTAVMMPAEEEDDS